MIVLDDCDEELLYVRTLEVCGALVIAVSLLQELLVELVLFSHNDVLFPDGEKVGNDEELERIEDVGTVTLLVTVGVAPVGTVA